MTRPIRLKQDVTNKQKVYVQCGNQIISLDTPQKRRKKRGFARRLWNNWRKDVNAAYKKDKIPKNVAREKQGVVNARMADLYMPYNLSLKAKYDAYDRRDKMQKILGNTDWETGTTGSFLENLVTNRLIKEDMLKKKTAPRSVSDVGQGPGGGPGGSPEGVVREAVVPGEKKDEAMSEKVVIPPSAPEKEKKPGFFENLFGSNKKLDFTEEEQKAFERISFDVNPITPDEEILDFRRQNRKNDPITVVLETKDGATKIIDNFESMKDFIYATGEGKAMKPLLSGMRKANNAEGSGYYLRVIDPKTISHLVKKVFDTDVKDAQIFVVNWKSKAGFGRFMLNRKGKFNKPLYDDEIVSMLSPYADFKGIFMRDELPEFLDDMSSKKMYNWGVVMNTDTTRGTGKHWVGITSNMDPEKASISYYDPFGEEPSADVLKALKEYVTKLPFYAKLKINSVVHQHDRSNRCGIHVSRFLETMFKSGYDFKRSTDFDLQSGEKDAMEKEKKFREFGFI